MIAVATIGILINGATALLFARGRHSDLNLRGAYLHMIGDAAISAGVVVAGAAIWWSGEPRIDPLVGIGIALIIAAASWRLLRSQKLALHQTGKCSCLICLPWINTNIARPCSFPKSTASVNSSSKVSKWLCACSSSGST